MTDLYEYPIEPLLSEADVTSDVQGIQKAVKGLGSDKKALIAIFGNRTAAQTAQIVKAYKAHQGENLIDVIKKETSGDLERLLVALCHSGVELDCELINGSITLTGADEEAILKVLLCKSNEELEAIKQQYKSMFNKDLEDHVSSKVGGLIAGDVKRLFVALLQCARKDGEPTAEDVASFPDNIFSFFTTKSESFLKKLFHLHNEKGGKSVEELIEKKFSGQAEKLLLLMCGSILNKPRFYARLLDATMKGVGTNERELNHLMARCREPALMGAIKIAYVDQFSKTLESKLKSETTGNYETLLVTIAERGKAVKK